jgi:hypothetical protein
VAVVALWWWIGCSFSGVDCCEGVWSCCLEGGSRRGIFQPRGCGGGHIQNLMMDLILMTEIYDGIVDDLISGKFLGS